MDSVTCPVQSAENAMSDTRILFVDDDRDILAMVEQYLTIKGYDVTTVDNGIEAVGIVKEKEIDIVFTDYKMPEFNGLGASGGHQEIPSPDRSDHRHRLRIHGVGHSGHEIRQL
jgi:PleD family two-component response regulator